MIIKEKEHNEMRDYWQKNIDLYGKFYDKNSEEQIDALPVIDYFYRKIAFPLEKDMMMDRYKKVTSYIEKNVKENSVVVDLGCGTGIFTIEILRRNCHVICVDYVESALMATRQRVEFQLPTLKDNVEYILLDIMESKLPKSDHLFCIGVTPYINSLKSFFENTLPTTDIFYCFFLNDKNWVNKIRKKVTFLNVRKCYYHDIDEIDNYLYEYNFLHTSREFLTSRFTMGTSFLDEMRRIE